MRAAAYLRANALAKGNSGVRLSVVEALAELLNKGVCPVVPQKGSVGASGDLAPLAHIALSLMGKGMARYRGELLPAAEALARAGIEPLQLEAKEGLALTNGVQMTAAVLGLTVDLGYRQRKPVTSLPRYPDKPFRSYRRLRRRDHKPKAACGCSRGCFKPRSSHGLATGHVRQVRVQDAYTLRCIPQVHGAVRQCLGHVRAVVEVEFGSATDNPLVMDDGRVVSGGNFHGQPLGVAADYLGLSLCSLANISEGECSACLIP